MTRPNILFILADDLGWNDLSSMGSTFYESPNIDRIAEQGMRFSQGYANCQVCSPSRASILTGKYTTRHGITDWIGAKTEEAWREHGRHNALLPPEYEHRLKPDEITFAQALRDAGYRTFFAGKWHTGGEGSHPEDYGFEINKGGWHAGSPQGGYFSPYSNPKLESGPDGESLPLRLARETSEFMESSKDQPFLAFLSFYSVHAPLQTSQDRWEKFRKKAEAMTPPENRFEFDGSLPVRQVQDCPIYAGMIEAMDDAVGVVLEALDRLGLSDNTLVCFTSDNGGASSGDAYQTCMLPLRGGKGRQWEGGIREPLFFRWPGVVEPNTSCDVPVLGMDLYPTFLEAARVSVPDKQSIDGRSVCSLLRGEKDPVLAERDLFWHYPHYGNQGGDPSSIIRNGPWKLIHYYEDSRDELYNLETDPGETIDVNEENPEITDQLRNRLAAWLEQTNARIPIPDPEHDPEAEEARTQNLRTEFMAGLEAQHAEYLNPEWKPNDDWWGSQVVED